MPELHEVAFVASERKSFGSEKETAKQEPRSVGKKKRHCSEESVPQQLSLVHPGMPSRLFESALPSP